MLIAPRYSRVRTPVGNAWYAYTANGVVMLSNYETEPVFVRSVASLLGAPPVRRDPPASFARKVARAIARSDGSAVDLDALPEFQRRVLEATARIPWGETATYGDIAHMIGAPRAHRAVGTALARNPIPFLIPCHRIVRSDGTIGSYGMGGERLKQRLLSREGYTG
jgi:methylated-DNA-[protein]-cysteine S-methyltransferase